MSNDAWRWLVGLAVLAHGVGHVLFMPALAAMLKLDASGHSWLLTPFAGEGITKALATVVAGAALVAFVIVAGGVFTAAAWWRPLAVAAAIVSICVVAAMWDGLPSGPAMAAVVFDLIVLVAIVVAHWPSEDVIGA